MHISSEQFKAALSAPGIVRKRNLDVCEHFMVAKVAARRQDSSAACSATVRSSKSTAHSADSDIVSQTICISPLRPSQTRIQWWSVLASGVHGEYGFVWTLREELVSALDELQMLEDVSDSYAEEITGYRDLFEGATRLITVNAYERNPTARALCVQHYGATCVVCGFDFGRAYGQIGREFIHVHHLLEISQIGREYRVDPVADLRPVCPNCHAMLHRRRPALSIDEVREHIRNATTVA